MAFPVCDAEQWQSKRPIPLDAPALSRRNASPRPQVALGDDRRLRYHAAMSTLAEIEAAAATLSPEEQKLLERYPVG